MLQKHVNNTEHKTKDTLAIIFVWLVALALVYIVFIKIKFLLHK